MYDVKQCSCGYKIYCTELKHRVRILLHSSLNMGFVFTITNHRARWSVHVVHTDSDVNVNNYWFQVCSLFTYIGVVIAMSPNTFYDDLRVPIKTVTCTDRVIDYC